MILICVTIGVKVILIHEKRPRHYAAEYLAATTKEQKIAIVNSIPNHLKGLTKLHIDIAKEKQKYARKK